MALAKKELDELTLAGQKLQSFLILPIDSKGYKQAINKLDELLDIVGDNENHPLSVILHALGSLISDYENNAVAELNTSPVKRLKYLMEQEGLTQKDLVNELGTQSIVSEILNNKRELNKRHILALSQRFNLSPAVFM